MAKRKLSDKQRANLKRSISQQLGHKVDMSDIVKNVASKYSISTETARWYLKKHKNGKATRNGKPKRTAKKTRARKRRSVVKAHRNGNGLRLVDAVQGFSREQLRRALSAKEVAPQLEASRRRQATLKEQANRALTAVRAVERQTQRLEKRFRALTRR